MLDTDTFLTTLYVVADAFCRDHAPALPRDLHPGPAPSLTRSEVVTLALYGQWARFGSERAFYRYATVHLRAAFPTLPRRSQLNRLLRRHQEAITAFGLWLGRRVARATDAAYEALDGTAAVVRNAKRRGTGWLPGQADRGWSTRLGWYEGFHVLTAVAPVGAITGFGAAPASTNDRFLADTLFAARATRAAADAGTTGLPSAGLPSAGLAPAAPGGSGATAYAMDSGFAGAEWEAHWAATYGVHAVCAPQRGSHRHRAWPAALRRWFAGVRQIVETVNDRLLHSFRLATDRPHDRAGFLAHLAAKVALHNFCIWLNGTLARPPLAFADLIDWP